MDEVLNNWDLEDYDAIKELIPFVFKESYEEYNRSFNFGDEDRDDLKFIIAERIWVYLLDYSDWNPDLDTIMEEVDKYYKT